MKEGQELTVSTDRMYKVAETVEKKILKRKS